MLDFISGAVATCYLIAAMFFLRFWKKSRDPLFAIFSVAFCVLCIQRIAFLTVEALGEHATILYTIRLLAFCLILYAIVDKNRITSKHSN